MKKWRANNKEDIRAYGEQYYEKNKERNKEQCKEWRKNNPDRNAQKSLRRYSLKKKLRSDFTFDEWEECKTFFDYKCAYCGQETKEYVQEHFIPVSKQGGYTKGNIVFSCKTCNLSKTNHDFFHWYKRKPFYSHEREKRVLDYLEMQSDGG